MLAPIHRLLPVFCVACSLTACVPVGRVVLLPQEHRPASAVVVTTDTGSMRLDAPYATTEVLPQGVLNKTQTNADYVRERYPVLLDLTPRTPQQFTLNFLPGSSTLTPESLSALSAILEAASARSGGEIVVIGHTDRQGAADANDALSLQRANSIRDLLVQRGFRPELIQPVGRGEREPLVPTDDDVPEPRNRRADVIVR